MRFTDRDKKLVSTRTEYGGTRLVLAWKNMAEETCGLGKEVSRANLSSCRTGIHFSDDLVAFSFLLRFDLALVLILFQTRIPLRDDPLNSSNLLLNAHPGGVRVSNQALIPLCLVTK